MLPTKHHKLNESLLPAIVINFGLEQPSCNYCARHLWVGETLRCSSNGVFIGLVRLKVHPSSKLCLGKAPQELPD